MNPDLVDEAKQEDESRAPDNKLVMEGPALRKLDEGTLVRDGRAYDVTAPADKRSEGTAYEWSPGDLRLPIEELRQRYDPVVWDGFKQFAENTKLQEEETLWEWLSRKKRKKKD